MKYEGEWKEGMHLEGIYTKFNMDRPEDFTGHSLSVGDVVVLNLNGKETAHFVDSVGFVEVPEFFLESEPEQTRKVIEENVGVLLFLYKNDCMVVKLRLNGCKNRELLLQKNIINFCIQFD